MKTKLGLGFTLLIITSFAGLAQETDFVPGPGVYSNKQILVANWKTSANVELSFDGKQWVEAPSKLSLGALDGEERTYILYIREKSKTNIIRQNKYVINRKGPQSALPDLLPGVYDGAIGLHFRPSDKISKTVIQVSDGVNSIVSQDQVTLAGKPGSVIQYSVSVRAFDSQGNGGVTDTYTYAIDRSNEPLVSEIKLLSPVPGTFANRQMLAIADEGLSDISYSLNGTAYKYNSPILLPALGQTTLVVEAKNGQGKVLSKKLNFTAGDQVISVPEQGYVYESTNINPLSGYTFNRTEGTLNANSPPFSKQVSLVVERDILTTETLRLYRLTDGQLFRFVYLLQGIPPSPPRVLTRLIEPNSVKDALGFIHEYMVQSSDESKVEKTRGSGITQTQALITVEAARTLQANFAGRYKNGPLGAESILSINSPSIENGPDLKPKYDNETNNLSNWLPLNFKGWVRFVSGPWEPSAWFYTEDQALEVPVQWLGKIEYQVLEKTDSLTLRRYSVSAQVDTRLPAAPTITLDGFKVRIDGSGSKIIYGIFDLSRPKIEAEMKTYEGEFSLANKIGENHVWQVRAYSIADNGKQSGQSISEPVPSFTTNPDTPKLKGLSQNSISVGDENLKLEIEDQLPGLQYLYIVTDYQGKNSARNELLGPIELEGTKGQKTVYSIKIVASVAKNKSLISDALELRVEHNRKVPELPKISGISQGLESRDAVKIHLDSTQGLTYSLSVKGESSNFVSWDKDLLVEGAKDKRVVYEFKYRVVDGDGNLANSPLYEFAIDRDIPQSPSFVLRNLKSEEIVTLSQSSSYLIYSNNSQSLNITSGTDDIEYRLSSSNTSSDWIKLSSPLKFEAIPLTDQLIKVEARASDRAGNLSETTSLELHLDLVTPDAPPLPQIVRANNKGRVVWPKLEGLEFREGPEGEYKSTTNNYEFSLKNDQVIKFSMRVVDHAGNISVPVDFELAYLPIALKPSLKPGYPTNLGSKAELEFGEIPEGIDIVYTLDGSEPNEKSLHVEQGKLKIINEVNVETELVLKFRAVSKLYEASEVSIVKFKIDTRAPDAPIANIADDLARLDSYKVIEFRSNDQSDTVETSVSRFVYDPNDLSALLNDLDLVGDDFRPNQTKLVVEPEPNKIVITLISARSRDLAGNVSTKTKNWKLFTAPGIYFVKEQNANVMGDGSLFRPLQNLAEAVSKAPDLIIAGQGNLPVDNLRIAKSMVIKGNFDFSNYLFKQSDTGTPTVVFPKQKGLETALFIDAATVTLQDLYVLDGGLSAKTLIRVQKGNLVLESSLLVTGKGTSGVSVNNGTLKISNSRLSTQEALGQALIDTTNSELLIDNSVVEGLELPPILQRKFSTGIAVLIQSTGSRLTISKSQIIPRRGQTVVALKLTGGTLRVSSSKIYSGVASDTSTILDLNTVDAVLDGVDLISRSDTFYSVMVRANGGTVSMSNGTVDIEALQGAIGIMGIGAQVFIDHVNVEGRAAKDFTTFMSLNDSRTKVTSLDLSLTANFETAFLKMVGSEFDGKDLRVLFDGEAVRSAFYLLEASELNMSRSSIETKSGTSAFTVVPTIKHMNVDDTRVSGWLYVAGEGSGTGQEYRAIDEDRYAFYGTNGIIVKEIQTQRGL